jgi:hypothetical protein
MGLLYLLFARGMVTFIVLITERVTAFIKELKSTALHQGWHSFFLQGGYFYFKIANM